MQQKMKFGTAGIPHIAKGKSVLAGFRAIKELGLDGMEVEFVYGARMKEEDAKKIAAYIKDAGLFATVHGPYYINLNSLEPEKIAASEERILKSARLAGLMGAKSLTFHAAFYLQQDPKQVYQKVKRELAKLARQLRNEKIDIPLRPELTGKPSQFGDLAEITDLAREVEGVEACIDFSHYYARYAGKNNSYKEFAAALEVLKQKRGVAALRELHLHVSGIEYTAKGERKHLTLQESDFNYRELLRALADCGAAGYLICESPNLEADALLMKKYYASLI